MTISTNELPAGLRLIVNPPSLLLLLSGAELVQHVSRISGLPNPGAWPENTLRDRVLERQAIATHVTVVVHEIDPDTAVGHALLEPADPEKAMWGIRPDIAALTAAGHLKELGGLAVHPDHQREGIAAALRDIRILIAEENGWVPAVAVWANGRSRAMYDGKPGWEQIGTAASARTGETLVGYAQLPADRGQNGCRSDQDRTACGRSQPERRQGKGE